MGNPADVLWEGQGGARGAQETRGALASSDRSSAARSHDGSLDGGCQCQQKLTEFKVGRQRHFSITAPWTVSLGAL